MPSPCILPSPSSPLSFHPSMAAMLISAPRPCPCRSLPTSAVGTAQSSQGFFRGIQLHAMGCACCTWRALYGLSPECCFSLFPERIPSLPPCWPLQRSAHKVISAGKLQRDSGGNKAATRGSCSGRPEAESTFRESRKAVLLHLKEKARARSQLPGGAEVL